MALNDIKVPKENSGGTFDEVVLTGAQIGLEKPATGNASSTQVVLGNDTRLSDARTPSSTLAHAASHAAAGSDPLAPSDIQAQSIFSVESLVITTTTQVTLTAARAKIYDLVQYAGAQVDVKLPSTNALQGDIIVLRWGTGGDSIRIIQSASGSPITTVSSGEQKRFIRGATDTWSLVPVDTHTHPATAISDSTTAGRALLTGADAAAQRTSLGLGTAATSATGDFAAASHTHGNINSSGQVGSDSGRVLVTTTAGAVTTLALGTAGQVLRTKSDLSGVEFADPAAAGVTGAAASASDVLGVSGANITGVDANADRIVFWDDSASALKYLEAGSGLSISGTTMTVTATGGATNLFLAASQFIPRTTNGCGVDSRELSTNRTNWDELLFDTASDEFAQAVVVMPSNYNNGTISARFYWTYSTAASGSNTRVDFGIRGRAFADDDALDTAFGSPQTVQDTAIAINDMHVTSATSAVTIAGTPAANRPILFEIHRDTAADNYGFDARLLGVEIIFN